MSELKLIPYNVLEKKNFKEEVVIQLKKLDFDNIAFKENTFTFKISECNFRDIKIENSEEIAFQEIMFIFIDCFIGEIKVENITSGNVSIHIINSVIEFGRVSSNKINSFYVNNCYSRNLFLLNQNSIQIRFTEENTTNERWQKIFQNINYQNDYLEYLRSKQLYHIYHPKKVLLSTNEIENNDALWYKLSELHLILNLDYSQELIDTETSIKDLYLKSLQISGYANGKISIENTRIDNWYLRNFAPQKELTFYNIHPLKIEDNERKIEFHKCNLDNSWFDNIDFTEYNIVSFFRTKFGKAVFTSCNFQTEYPTFETFQNIQTVENVHYPEKKPDNYYKNQYEIFLQLKQSLELSGNYYESQKLQALSNDALKQIKDIPTQDKIILWINALSNNHGLSILRPLIGFFFFSFYLYMIYVDSLHKLDTKGFSFVGSYFSFIDLTHRADFLVDRKDLNTISLIADSLNKIITGFFIFQFISAFRKYNKK